MTSSKATPTEEIPKYKLIFLGDQSVGKSCILNRFMNDAFNEEYQATIGLDFQSKDVLIEGQKIHLLLYDTAGQEKFRSLIPMYTRDANIILFVYDISCRDSFLHLTDWIKESSNAKVDEIIFALAGNKNDLEDKREISYEEGKKFAEEHNYIFQEISAKTSDGFSELFNKKLFDKIKTKFNPAGEKPKTEIKNDEQIKIEKQKGKKKKKCC